MELGRGCVRPPARMSAYGTAVLAQAPGRQRRTQSRAGSAKEFCTSNPARARPCGPQSPFNRPRPEPFPAGLKPAIPGRAQAGTDAAASHSTQNWGCCEVDRTSRACSVRDTGPSLRGNVPTPPQPISELYIVGGGSPQLCYHDDSGTTSQVTRQGRRR